MKHLKSYKIFESDSYKVRQERINTLIDMSLELWDEDFNVQVSDEVLTDDDKSIVVRIQKRSKGRFGRFNYNDIKDTFLSMVSYMESEDYNFNNIDIKLQLSDTILHTGSSHMTSADLKGEELYLLEEDGISYPMNPLFPIGQMVIKFKE